MPATARVSVKVSMVYLVIGFLLGALMLLNRWIPLGSAAALVRTPHVHMLVVGWITQLILGVAWWLFPPLQVGLRSDAPLPVRRGQTQRGSEPLFWATFACLNAGILLRCLSEPLLITTQSQLFTLLITLSGLLELAAVVLFVLNVWGRVRELGRNR